MAKSDIDVRLRLRDARRFQADAKRSKQSVEGFAGSARRAGRGMQDVGARTASFGKSLTQSVTLPILGAGAAAFKMHADFEDSMSKITGLVGISEKQVGTWSNDILRMSKDLPQSPKELADAMFFITSAGLRGKTALDALNVSARASAGGLGETKSVADAVTSAMNAYGKDVLGAGRATDILTAAVKEGKLEAASLAPVIGRILPTAEASGVAFEEVAGALALMSKSGTDAAQGATQINGILGAFQKPSSEMTDSLEEMGLGLGKVRRMIANKGLVATLDTLRSAAAEAGIDLAKVFSEREALRGVLQLTRDMKETNSVMDGVRKSAGMSDAAFAAASKTAKFQMAKALTSLQVTAIQLGAALGPTLVPMIQKAGNFIGKLGEKFQGLSPTMKKVVGGVLLFLAAIGPVMWVLGGIVGGIGSLILVALKLTKVFKVVALAWKVLNLAFVASPIGLIVAGIILLGLAFVLAYKKIGWFRNAVGAVWRWLKTAAVNAFNWVKKAAGNALGWIKSNWKKLLPLIAGPIGLVVVVLASNWGKIKSGVVGVWNTVKTVFGNVVGFVKSVPGKIASAAKGMWGGIKTAAASVFAAVANLWNDTVGSLSFNVPGWVPGMGGKGFSMPKIPVPELASGGLVSGFGSFISGERGPELNTITPQGVVVQPLSVAMAGPAGAAGPAAAPEAFPLRATLQLPDGRALAEFVGQAVRDRRARE